MSVLPARELNPFGIGLRNAESFDWDVRRSCLLAGIVARNGIRVAGLVVGVAALGGGDFLLAAGPGDAGGGAVFGALAGKQCRVKAQGATVAGCGVCFCSAGVNAGGCRCGSARVCGVGNWEC